MEIMIKEHYYIPISLYIIFNIILRANKCRQKQTEYAWNGKFGFTVYYILKIIIIIIAHKNFY